MQSAYPFLDATRIGCDCEWRGKLLDFKTSASEYIEKIASFTKSQSDYDN